METVILALLALQTLGFGVFWALRPANTAISAESLDFSIRSAMSEITTVRDDIQAILARIDAIETSTDLERAELALRTEMATLHRAMLSFMDANTATMTEMPVFTNPIDPTDGHVPYIDMDWPNPLAHNHESDPFDPMNGDSDVPA
jgi:hypothetical protein